jgi:hybrid cluster-associated redox disulfide protein
MDAAETSKHDDAPKLPITKATKIYDLLKAYPHLRQVFSRHAIACPFCAGSTYDSVAIGARKHHVDADMLLNELRAAAGQPPLPGKQHRKRHSSTHS